MSQMSSRPSFDIGHAAPLLNSLSLSDEALESTAYFPEMGYSYFFQFTLCPFVHGIVHGSVETELMRVLISLSAMSEDGIPDPGDSSGLPPEVASGDHPHPCVLVPLLEASSETLLRTRCHGEYADYDENGRLVCSTLLQWDDRFGIELDLATSMAPHNFTMIPLAMGVTGTYPHH
ncbi:hypothetical protein B0H10DRAFT_1968573 [Mycena sp. CBHHK59/15]|nr:hypothetical protein B0H10DRAFT_1968573 [Mycena sp. CBHHK59/15]